MKIAEAEKEGSVNKDRQESMAFCGKLAVIYCTYTMEMRSDSLLSKGKGIRRDYIIMQLINIPRAVGKLLCHFNQCVIGPGKKGCPHFTVSGPHLRDHDS